MTTTTKPTWGTSLPEIYDYCKNRGFDLILRNGFVHAFHANAPRHCLRRSIDNGRWMQDMPILRESHLYEVWPTEQSGEWKDCSKDLDIKTVLEFRAIVRDCYCYQGVGRCDFCTGLRRPDKSHNEYSNEGLIRSHLHHLGFKPEGKATHRFVSDNGNDWAVIHGLGSNAGLPTVYVLKFGTYDEQNATVDVEASYTELLNRCEHCRKLGKV